MTWVDDRVYAAGGSHVPATWETFARQTGITAVLHLRPGSPEAFVGPAPAAFLWLDVSDEAQAGLELRLQAGRFVQQRVAAGDRVLLHGSLGRHRVRWAFVAYRLCTGQSLKAALRAAEQRPWLAPYHTDLPAWEAFAAYLMEARVPAGGSNGGGDHAV